MKDLLKNGALIVLAIVLAYIVFLRECKPGRCPPDGSVLVTQAFLDSLKEIANRPPVIIKKDSIVYKDTTIYLPGEIPDPVIIDPEINLYRDSVYNDSIRFWNNVLVKGTILKWDKWYKPVIFTKTITIETTKPVPVPYDVPVSKNGLYVSGLIGGNANLFGYGAGADFINKKEHLYGAQYLRMNNENYVLAKIGFKIKIK